MIVLAGLHVSVKTTLAACGLVAFLILLFCVTGCARKEPIRIGFAEQLSGTGSDIGVASRNGAELAVENINASGGINGRPIELIIRDDRGTRDGVRATDRDLINAGVVAIIGHARSQQTREALPIINAEPVVLISPTASSPQLNRKSRYFFNVNSSVLPQASGFAQEIREHHPEIKRIAIILDSDNISSTGPYRDAFVSAFQSLGGAIVSKVEFSGQAKPDFDPIVENLRTTNPQGLLFLTNSFDNGLIAQRIRITDWDLPLYSSSFAGVDVIKFGGKAVEGMEVALNYDWNSQSPAFLEFKREYKAKYGENPASYSAFGYETVKVLAAALRKTGGRREGLRQALLQTKNFEGLVDKFSFDSRGRTTRPNYIAIVRNGQMKTVRTITPFVPKKESTEATK